MKHVYRTLVTLCVGMPQRTLRVRLWDALRPGLHSHAERGNDQGEVLFPGVDWPAGLLRLLKQHRVGVHHVRVIDLQQQRQIIA